MRLSILSIVFLHSFICSFGQRNISTLENEPSIRAIDASGSHNIWISGSKGSILHSKDGGNSWTNHCPEEYSHLDFRGISVLTDSVIIVMSAGDGAEGKAIVIKSIDQGHSWKKVIEEKTKGVFFDTIKFKSPWTGYLLGDPIDAYPYLLKTIDGGETWNRVTGLPPIEEEDASYAASNSCITTLGDNIWFHTQNRVFHSFNAGENWQVYNTLFLKGKSQGIFGIFALDAYTLLAVGGDYLPHKEPTLQYAQSNSSGQAWYTHKDFWRIGLTECLDTFGDKKHILSVGTHGSAISKDGGFSWKSIDDDSFHVVKCFEETCIAAGANGRIGIISMD
jgi:photosystem II stability/assembly factor-like uncharacterized protein